jgi:hypothetical protein
MLDEIGVPGSAHILPANPLAKISETALAGHVDCTLFKATHSPPIALIAKLRRWPLWFGAAASAVLIASVSIAGPFSDTSEARPAPVAMAAPPPEVTSGDWPIVGEGPCRVSVFATPAGASIDVDGTSRGQSPLTIATTCGQHRVDVSHRTHRTMTVWAHLRPGEPESMEIALTRAIHIVSITSAPTGASIYLDGVKTGRTPKVLNVLGHVPVTVEVKKPGYRPVVQHIINATPHNNVSLQLTPIVRKKRQAVRQRPPAAAAPNAVVDETTKRPTTMHPAQRAR